MSDRIRAAIGRAFCLAGALACLVPGVASCPALADTAAAMLPVAVGAQYDTTHVYVSPDDFDRFVASLIATFGGKTTPQAVVTVTPTPSKTKSQLVMTPVGTLSVFGFETPIPYPFGAERTGYLVSDFGAGVAAAQASGADVVVSPFDDPVGKDAVVQWPGGVYTQLYWHTTAPSFPKLDTVPENRVYVSALKAAEFIRDFVAFSHGTISADVGNEPGIEIGRPNDTFRRVEIESTFGRLAVFVTNGFLPYPYGREVTGYEVRDLASTLARAAGAGVTILAGPYASSGRRAAMVQFPGGYVAEIHQALR